MSNKRYYNFCYTLFPNANTNLDQVYKKLIEKNCTYFCFGEETCPTSGRVHHQGYLEFKHAKSISATANILNKAHVEPRKGTQEDAISYTRGGDRWGKPVNNTWIEWGTKTPNERGKRNDLSDIRSAVLESNKSLPCIVTELCTNFQQLRFAECLYKYRSQRRDWIPNVRWYWGPTGTGKTRRAVCESGDYWMSGRNLKWWDGYSTQENIIIDDFRADYCTFHELLRILDSTPFRVEFKGGSTELLAKNIWITSPYPPDEVYRNRTEEDIMQLMRRITTVVKFEK